MSISLHHTDLRTRQVPFVPDAFSCPQKRFLTPLLVPFLVCSDTFSCSDDRTCQIRGPGYSNDVLPGMPAGCLVDKRPVAPLVQRQPSGSCPGLPDGTLLARTFRESGMLRHPSWFFPAIRRRHDATVAFQRQRRRIRAANPPSPSRANEAGSGITDTETLSRNNTETLPAAAPVTAANCRVTPPLTFGPANTE